MEIVYISKRTVLFTNRFQLNPISRIPMLLSLEISLGAQVDKLASKYFLKLLTLLAHREIQNQILTPDARMTNLSFLFE